MIIIITSYYTFDQLSGGYNGEHCGQYEERTPKTARLALHILWTDDDAVSAARIHVVQAVSRVTSRFSWNGKTQNGTATNGQFGRWLLWLLLLLLLRWRQLRLQLIMLLRTHMSASTCGDAFNPSFVLCRKDSLTPMTGYNRSWNDYDPPVVKSLWINIRLLTKHFAERRYDK